MRTFLFSLLLLTALGTGPAVADSNIAYIEQIGSNNAHNLLQDGSRHFAQTTQTGIGHTTTMKQYGIGNHATVEQGGGNSNIATVEQYGGVRARIVQTGTGNQATSYQALGTRPVTIHQNGNAKVEIVTVR
jgi:hypothetical protein